MVASKNPVKIKATKEAFHSFFKVFSVESSETVLTASKHTQPVGEDETREFSRSRILKVKELNPGYDFYVGIEGGIVKLNSKEARIIVYTSVGNHGKIETIRGCEIPLPIDWYKSLKEDEFRELGDLVEKESGVTNIKQKQGAVGYFTNNYVTRIDILKQSVIMALIPYRNEQLFSSRNLKQ